MVKSWSAVGPGSGCTIRSMIGNIDGSLFRGRYLEQLCGAKADPVHSQVVATRQIYFSTLF